jgi:hypothetical protein
MGILSGVIGDSSAGIAEYSRAIHSLGANDVPSFLSAGSALGLEVVLTALFLYVFFNATSAVAKPEMAGLTIGGYPLVAHLIGVPLGDSSLILLAASGQPFFRGNGASQRLGVYFGAHNRRSHRYALYRITSKSDAE